MLYILAKVFIWFKSVYKFIVLSKSKDKDFARREFILNVLLLGSIVLSFIATFSAFIGEIRGSSPKGSSIEVFIILLIFIFGYYLSRKGKSRWVSYALICIYILATTYSAYKWGADFGQGLLTYALIIVMSGVLIGSLFSFIITSIISFILFSLIYVQAFGIVSVNSSWRNKPANLRDALVYAITFFIIALVSWLFNREIEKALKRARASEAALQKQKDQLEILVEKRTRELKQVQAEKLTQLYRFAEFGKMASGLFHDLVDPLALVSFNLDRLNEKSKKIKQQEVKRLLDRAMVGMKRLEGFVLAARNQMQNQEVLQLFSLRDEIFQVIQILAYKAKKAHVSIYITEGRIIQTFGSSIKFNQLMTNLITNAIDSYDTSIKKEKRIEVHVQKINKRAYLTVRDWGCGIQEKNIKKIFDPFFTTKSFEKGTGMGLAICRDIIEKDFKGKIQVTSKETRGTMFTIIFPIKN